MPAPKIRRPGMARDIGLVSISRKLLFAHGLPNSADGYSMRLAVASSSSGGALQPPDVLEPITPNHASRGSRRLVLPQCCKIMGPRHRIQTLQGRDRKNRQTLLSRCSAGAALFC